MCPYPNHYNLSCYLLQLVLGKPVGTVQKSKFDKDASKIIELLDLGLSIRKIAKFLGYKNHISLNTYVNKRNLKDEV